MDSRIKFPKDHEYKPVVSVTSPTKSSEEGFVIMDEYNDGGHHDLEAFRAAKEALLKQLTIAEELSLALKAHTPHSNTATFERKRLYFKSGVRLCRVSQHPKEDKEKGGTEHNMDQKEKVTSHKDAKETADPPTMPDPQDPVENGIRVYKEGPQKNDNSQAKREDDFSTIDAEYQQASNSVKKLKEPAERLLMTPTECQLPSRPYSDLSTEELAADGWSRNSGGSEDDEESWDIVESWDTEVDEEEELGLI